MFDNGPMALTLVGDTVENVENVEDIAGREAFAGNVDDTDRRVALGRLQRVADRVCPVVLAGDQMLPVLDPLATMLPGGGLRRGTTVSIEAPEGGGARSLAHALAAGPVEAGSWVALVGLADAGLVSAAGVGLPLERLVSICSPEPSAWAEVVAALIGAFDLVLVAPRHRVRHSDARRLAARARERGSVVVRAGGDPRRWPEGADLVLRLVDPRWEGLGQGSGHLMSRRVVVEVGGRRELSRVQRHELLLPGPGGVVAAVEATAEGFAGSDTAALVESRTPEPVAWSAAG